MRPAPVEFVSITFTSLFECQVCGAKVNAYLICTVSETRLKDKIICEHSVLSSLDLNQTSGSPD
jgi:transcription elongation factor Elf1